MQFSRVAILLGLFTLSLGAAIPVLKERADADDLIGNSWSRIGEAETLPATDVVEPSD